MSENRGYDIRSILNEMQQEYWQGLSEKVEVQEELLECITFTLGEEEYAFETSFASEVIRVPKLVKLPGSNKLIVGIFNLRGEIIAAMDIRPLLGIPAPALTAPSAGRPCGPASRAEPRMESSELDSRTPICFDRD